MYLHELLFNNKMKQIEQILFNKFVISVPSVVYKKNTCDACDIKQYIMWNQLFIYKNTRDTWRILDAPMGRLYVR